MEIKELIRHPEQMNRDTLYELRSMLALHPYYQTVRLLMLQNLYLLHDATFDEELRKAAIYVSNRKAIFQMIEAAHYQLRNLEKDSQQPPASTEESRTATLIDSFLESIPADEPADLPHRRPTPADAAVDYMAYLMDCGVLNNDNQQTASPQLKGQDLIDTFLDQEQGRFQLANLPTESDSQEASVNDAEEDEAEEEEYFTETLARIYIKQGRYQKAYDIISRLNEQLPKKNSYFADQMRFLEKLIINSNKQNN